MDKWAVTIDNQWGKFAGAIAPVTITVKAVSYGEAVQRACRSYVESQFKVSAVKVPG
jgi:hypothetical protein